MKPWHDQAPYTYTNSGLQAPVQCAAKKNQNTVMKRLKCLGTRDRLRSTYAHSTGHSDQLTNNTLLNNSNV